MPTNYLLYKVPKKLNPVSALFAIIILVCAGLFASSPSLAKGISIYDAEEIKYCHKTHKNRLDYGRCLDTQLIKINREMLSWDTSIEVKLEELSESTGRSEALTSFKRSIRQFEKLRKTHCQWQYLATLPDITSASNLVKECSIDFTKTRINKLMELSAIEF